VFRAAGVRLRLRLPSRAARNGFSPGAGLLDVDWRRIARPGGSSRAAPPYKRGTKGTAESRVGGFDPAALGRGSVHCKWGRGLPSLFL